MQTMALSSYKNVQNFKQKTAIWIVSYFSQELCSLILIHITSFIYGNLSVKFTKENAAKGWKTRIHYTASGRRTHALLTQLVFIKKMMQYFLSSIPYLTVFVMCRFPACLVIFFVQKYVRSVDMTERVKTFILAILCADKSVFKVCKVRIFRG